MLKLGITGGIGSGKTTFCRILAEDHHARLFLADPEAKRLMLRPDVRAEVEAVFPGSYFADGSLDRAALAAAVFGDTEALGRLNAIVHPRVGEAVRHAITEAAADGVPLFVYESALLLQSGIADRAGLDATVALVADPDVRAARAAARDDAPETTIRARMAHQLADAELRERADTVIENSGSLADLRGAAADLVASLGAARK